MCLGRKICRMLFGAGGEGPHGVLGSVLGTTVPTHVWRPLDLPVEALDPCTERTEHQQAIVAVPQQSARVTGIGQTRQNGPSNSTVGLHFGSFCENSRIVSSFVKFFVDISSLKRT